MVRLPSGAGYWTVLDEELAVVPAADAFLRHLRFGRDGAESTTRAYAGAIALRRFTFLLGADDGEALFRANRDDAVGEDQ
jgi:hypothetical protein